jgi:hypothetical protein
MTYGQVKFEERSCVNKKKKKKAFACSFFDCVAFWTGQGEQVWELYIVAVS